MAQKSERERNIELEILVWINKQPQGFAFKINQSGFYDTEKCAWLKRNNGSLKGIPDILGIWMGRPIAIEVKTPTGRLSKEQGNFLKKWELSEGIAIVARSLKDVVDALRMPA